MRRARTSLGALIILVAAAIPSVAQSKPSAAVSRTPSSVAHGAAQPTSSVGFAKSQSHKTGNSKASKTQTHKTGSKQASGRTKSSQSKKGRSRTKEAHARPKSDHIRFRPVAQLQVGAARLFAGWPFTRPGSPGRSAGDLVGHQSGGFVGWFGPVFWPYAYDDIFAYAFWPLDSFDYGEAFWAFAYDDLFEWIFWADSEVETPHEIVAAAEPDVPNSEDRSRAGAPGLEGQSREFAQICGDRTPGLSQWPILRIAQSVGLSREQRAALKGLQAAATEAARVIKSSCPVETPTTPVGRLDAMQDRVRAMLRAIDLVRPALENFYESLNEAQKARFNITAAHPAGADDLIAPAGGENELVPQICTDHPSGLLLQTVDRLEHVVRPTESQRGALEALRTAAARAAQILRDACPAGTPGNPPERLAAMQQRLGAMLEAASIIHPALQSIYAALSDAQKTRFNAIGKQAGRIGG